MKLSNLLRPGLIKPGLEARNKRQAIGELVDLLVHQREIPLSQRDHMLEAVLENEASLGTGMENGIALPHGFTDRVQDVLCALGTAPNGIPFDSRDDQPANLVVLFLLPARNHAGEAKIVANINHLLEHHNLAERLEGLASPDEIHKIIQDEEKY